MPGEREHQWPWTMRHDDAASQAMEGSAPPRATRLIEGAEPVSVVREAEATRYPGTLPAIRVR